VSKKNKKANPNTLGNLADDGAFLASVHTLITVTSVHTLITVTDASINTDRTFYVGNQEGIYWTADVGFHRVLPNGMVVPNKDDSEV
jgi:hypothetical protein